MERKKSVSSSLPLSCFELLLWTVLVVYLQSYGNLQYQQLPEMNTLGLESEAFVHLPRESPAALSRQVPQRPRDQHRIFSRGKERGGGLHWKIAPAAHT